MYSVFCFFSMSMTQSGIAPFTSPLASCGLFQSWPDSLNVSPQTSQYNCPFWQFVPHSYLSQTKHDTVPIGITDQVCLLHSAGGSHLHLSHWVLCASANSPGPALATFHYHHLSSMWEKIQYGVCFTLLSTQH